MEPSRLLPLLAMMDDPHRASASERTTWQSDAERSSEHKPSHWWRTLGIIALGGIVAVAVMGAGVLYWRESRNHESTDDAFIDGYMTQIAPRVAGPVVALEFSDNQHVNQGQTLVRLD